MEGKLFKFNVITRRNFLCGAITAGLLLVSGADLNLLAAENSSNSKKPLVVYYSHSGNTAKLAKTIHDKVGGDLLEIVTSFEYPDNYNELTKVAKEQQQAGFRPPLSMTMPNLDDYDVIYLGYPNWWSSMAMPVYSFVEQSGINGKTILPFCTHGGGGLGHSVADLKKLVPQSKVQDALSVSGNRAGQAGSEVDKWLNGMGLK